ncbi:MAG: hypothetical protein KAR20_28155 [Candidatus Heimdallarchaeota archaeon]|nr:hypothetical protein [Candidatus Heimdallarchaeota archaeon]
MNEIQSGLLIVIVGIPVIGTIFYLVSFFMAKKPDPDDALGNAKEYGWGDF